MDEMEMQRKKPSQNIKSVLVTGAGGFLFGMTVWQTLIVQGFVGIILYVGMARIFKLEHFSYLIITF